MRESADLGQPAALKALKQRLSEAKSDMARTKQAYNRYNQPDAELSKIDAEVKSITSKRNLRAEQMVRASSIHPSFVTLSVCLLLSIRIQLHLVHVE